MARRLGLGHGEAHVREEASRAAFADVALGLGVRLGAGRPDDVEAQLAAQPLELPGGHCL